MPGHSRLFDLHDTAVIISKDVGLSADLQVILVPAGSAVTTDYRSNRIRIFYDPTSFVVVEPRPSIG